MNDKDWYHTSMLRQTLHQILQTLHQNARLDYDVSIFPGGTSILCRPHIQLKFWPFLSINWINKFTLCVLRLTAEDRGIQIRYLLMQLICVLRTCLFWSRYRMLPCSSTSGNLSYMKKWKAKQLFCLRFLSPHSHLCPWVNISFLNWVW